LSYARHMVASDQSYASRNSPLEISDGLLLSGGGGIRTPVLFSPSRQTPRASPVIILPQVTSRVGDPSGLPVVSAPKTRKTVCQ